jgi:hypothetical protein
MAHRVVGKARRPTISCDASYDSTATEQLYHYSYQREYEQDVNKATHGVSGHHSEYPHHDQDQKDGP